MKGYWFVPGMGTSVKFFEDKSLALMNICRALALLSVAGFFLYATFLLHETAPELRMTLRAAHASGNEITLTMRNVREASAEWKKASQGSQETAKHADKAIRDLDLFIAHTDFQLNQQVLPETGRAIDANSAQLLELEKAANASLTQLNTVLVQATATVDAATVDLTDPAIAQSLKNVGQISANVATTTSDAAATMASVRKGVEYEIHEITKPVTAAKKVVLFIAELAGKFLGI